MKWFPVSSTREIVNNHENDFQLNSSSTAVLFGGIDYDISTATMERVNKAASKVDAVSPGSTNPIPPLTRGIIRGDTLTINAWPALSGTKEEVDNIRTLLNINHISAFLFSDSSGVEDAFKRLQGDNSPDIIHISTHGFFYPKPGEDKVKNEMSERLGKANSFIASQNPLMRSGLIFAGANNKWKNDTLKFPAGVDDGILTSYEVSGMNLSNTKLAVLSACQTGLGDIKGSEGVYGLRRAFKMAGVKYIMVSLWEVPDDPTTDFMVTFYNNWLEHKDIETAFTITQSKMKTKYNDPLRLGCICVN